jgi:hypothetical protein
MMGMDWWIAMIRVVPKPGHANVVGYLQLLRKAL